jgi:hypothetical protein
MTEARPLCATCVSCLFEGDMDGDTCPECGRLSPFRLQVNQEYRLVSCRHRRRVPVVPWFTVPDWVKMLPVHHAKRVMLARTRYLKEGDLFSPVQCVVRQGKHTGIPWYRSVASGRGGQAAGWIDSVALVGWELERI